jgi:O-antigen ligase
VTAIFSFQPMHSLTRVCVVVSRFLPIALAAIFIDNSRKLFMALAALTLSVLAADSYAFWQSYHGIDRVFAFANHPIVLGALLIEIIPFLTLVGLMETDLNRTWRGILLTATVVSAIVLIMTSTRGAWLGLGAALVVYVALVAKRNPKSALIVALAWAIFCAAFVVIPSLEHRVDSMLNPQMASNTERVLMWRSSWQMFLDHPFTGVGLGMWSDVEKGYYISPAARDPDVHMHAHSNYFNFLSETGLIGFSAFLGLFVLIAWLMFRRYRSNPRDYWSLAMLLTTIAFSVQGLTEYNFGHLLVLRLYTFLLGLSLVGSRLKGTEG